MQRQYFNPSYFRPEWFAPDDEQATQPEVPRFHGGLAAVLREAEKIEKRRKRRREEESIFLAAL